MVRVELDLTYPLYLEADPSRLTQVIGNLLHNAAKFTSSNDLIIVTVSRDLTTHEAVIAVRDTGQGIAPDNLANLFDEFAQVDQHLGRHHGGLGLGLAIVKGMVELHGGRVEAFSEGRDKGATFTIRLPMTEKSTGMTERSAGLKSESNKPLRVLLIDDNEDLALAMSLLMNHIGHKAITSHNGTEGIARVKELRPDVVFCDIGLPGMSGYEVAQLLRKDPEHKNMFLIALSGYAQAEDIARAKEAGFDLHLSKPLSVDTLRQVLNKVS
jgi:CheY-like chemotaxis protein